MNHRSATALLKDISANTTTQPSELKKSWIGKALKWSAAGVTFTLIGKDVFGNVVFKATAPETLAAESVLIETIIGGGTNGDNFDGDTIDSAVTNAGGFGTLAPKVATWVIEDITGGTITLQSAEVTSAIGSFPHTHGSIVDYDIQSITDGDEIGIGAA